MVEPWLTIIGIGENAPTDLSDASLSLISESEYIFGGKRHLELVNANSKGIVWPVPFSINEVLKAASQQNINKFVISITKRIEDLVKLYDTEDYLDHKIGKSIIATKEIIIEQRSQPEVA